MRYPAVSPEARLLKSGAPSELVVELDQLMQNHLDGQWTVEPEIGKGKIQTNLSRNLSDFFLPECSHAILATAISQVSLTTSTSSASYHISFSNPRLLSSPSAPNASAASCLHIASSPLSSSTFLRYGTASKCLVWPKQYASSCFSNADGEGKAAAIAAIAGRVSGVEGC